MKNQIFSLLVITGFILMLTACTENSENIKEKEAMTSQDPKTLEAVQAYALGEWTSLTVELRPTEDRTGSGTVLPSYLKRHFNYLSKDKFIGTITMFGDNYGQLPLMEFEFKGAL
ncbi:MAG: hypothetical protein AAF135_13310, partial [Bacteroidota bacterium]